METFECDPLILYLTTRQISSKEMVLKKACDPEERQAELLQIALYRIRIYLDRRKQLLNSVPSKLSSKYENSNMNQVFF